MNNKNNQETDKRKQVGKILIISFIIIILLASIVIIIYPLESNSNYTKIVSGSFMIFFASIIFGLLFGFLFGVPKAKGKKILVDRPLSENKEESVNSNYDTNTNLEDISDWLTKIIVGVGLTQLQNIDPALGKLSDYLSFSLGITYFTDKNILISASGYIYTLLLYGSIAGFIFGYVCTRIYLPFLFFKFSEQMAINELKEELLKLNEKLGENDITANMYSALYEENGFNEAIKIGKSYLDDGNNPMNVHFWIYLCCAYSQKYEDNPKDSEVRNEALKYAKKAIETEREFALNILRYLWDPNLHGNGVENDLEIFYQDSDFKTLLG